MGASFFATQLQAAEQPNVVFILIDDLSHYGVTAYGADRISSEQGFFTNVQFSTPRIDSLATDGMLCSSTYAYPLCEPTRVALMSGMNNNRNYIQPKALYESQITFGDLFKRAGYATCITGKWKQSRGTKEFPGKDYISKFGWDEFCCFDVIGEGRRMIEPWLVVDGTSRSYSGTDPDTGRRWYGPDICNRYALDFIDRHKDQPFFLYYPMLLVHDEHTPTPDTVPKSVFDNFDVNSKSGYGHLDGDDRRYFPDMLAYMDKMIGKVLDKLDELGLRESTLVVVMGDNGTKECFSHILLDGSVFVGGKGKCKENGTHVPLLLRFSGTIPSGLRYDGLLNLTDLLPTLCDAAGIQVSTADDLDGISFWPQATGQARSAHREAIYTWYNANNTCTDLNSLIEYAQTKQFKRYAPDRNFPEGRFFDLRTDLFETVGDRKVKTGWNRWHHSGLDVNELTPEQMQAYDELGKVLEENRYVSVERLQIEKNETPLRIGQTQKLRCRIFPENATRRNVIWESSDVSVATIDKFGAVTAYKPGKFKITAYSWDDAYPISANAQKTFLKNGVHASATFEILPSKFR